MIEPAFLRATRFDGCAELIIGVWDDEANKGVGFTERKHWASWHHGTRTMHIVMDRIAPRLELYDDCWATLTDEALQPAREALTELSRQDPQAPPVSLEVVAEALIRAGYRDLGAAKSVRSSA